MDIDNLRVQDKLLTNQVLSPFLLPKLVTWEKLEILGIKGFKKLLNQKRHKSNEGTSKTSSNTIKDLIRLVGQRRR